MTCPRLAELACNQTGVGFTCAPVTPTATELHLMEGQGEQFPLPLDGEVFYVDVGGCGCCARLRVTARLGDRLTIEPSSTCSCIPAQARVAYASNSPEHMRLAAGELPFNVLPPLHWDCATRTLSVDCQMLKTMVDNPCQST